MARIRAQIAGAGTQVRTYYEYDELSRLKSVTIDMTPEDASIADGNVYRTTYEYHGTGSQLKQLKQSDGTGQNFTDTTAGRMETVTDALGRITRFNYDTPGRSSVTAAEGAVTVYGCDGNGRHTSVTAPAAGGVTAVTSLYYAYVYADDASWSVYVGPQFWRASAMGADSTAGTLVHEMSHFAGTGRQIPGSNPALFRAIDGYLDPATGRPAVYADGPRAGRTISVYGRQNASQLPTNRAL